MPVYRYDCPQGHTTRKRFDAPPPETVFCDELEDADNGSPTFIPCPKVARLVPEPPAT